MPALSRVDCARVWSHFRPFSRLFRTKRTHPSPAPSHHSGRFQLWLAQAKTKFEI